MSIRLAYVAGPYRAASAWDREQNVRAAEHVSLQLWRGGVPAICPHTMCRFYQDASPDAVWLEGMLEILRRCDAMVLCPGWQESEGTRVECVEATARGIPIYQSVAALLEARG
jgi:hypothetical protein